MAHHPSPAVSLLILLVTGTATALKTCPGFPGYCSESFPGQSCNVVCDFGRNNVPLCQEDGTWTDIPRCIEHEPGVDNQVPGVCPGIPGYCAQGFLNGRCKFDCVTGPDINSLCSSDGTWVPYPVCDGDLRETRDGCDGCPGPLGSNRNRTAESILAGRGQVDSRNLSNRIPKVGSLDEGRKTIPSFAGNTQFGAIDPEAKPLQQQPVVQQQQQPQRPQQPAQPQAPARQPQQQAFPQQQQQFAQPQQQFPQQQQQFPQQQQQAFQQGLNSFQASNPANQPLSLFDQIKNKINQGNNRPQQQQQPAAVPPPQQPAVAPLPQQPAAALPQQPAVAPAPQQQQRPQLATPGQQTFGPFEAVSLNNALQASERPRVVASPRSRLVDRPASQNNDDFFGVFPSVNLQGRRRK